MRSIESRLSLSGLRMAIDLDGLCVSGSIKMYLVSTLNPGTGDKNYYEFKDFVDSLWFMTHKSREGLTCKRYQEKDMKISKDNSLKELSK